jgi:hypothetical protein
MEMLTTRANEVLIGGAKGGGKSYILRWAAFLWALYVEGLEVYFFRRKFSDLRSNHVFGPEGFLAIAEPFIRSGKAFFNQSDNRLDFFHGDGKPSHIFLRHVQHDKDMENYRGIEAHAIIFDELTLFNEKVYNFLRTHARLGGHVIDYEKVRQSLPFVYDGYFPRICSGTNPGGPGHTFVKREFITPVPPRQIWKTPPEKGGMNRIFIPSKLTDNTKLIENDPGYADRIRGLGGALADAFLEGNWDIVDGGVISDLWDESIHVLPRLKIPNNATIMRALDWGTYHPSAIVYVWITNGEEITTVDNDILLLPPRSLIVIKEIYNCNGQDESTGNRKTPYDVGVQIADFESQVDWKIISGPADNQIFQNRGGTGHIVADIIAEGYTDKMDQIRRERIDGATIRSLMNMFDKSDQTSGSRVSGLAIFRSFLQGSISGDSKGLYFTENCRYCISTIPVLPRSEIDPEDVDTKSVDHLYDAVRYVCMAQQGEFKPIKIIGF